MYPDPCGSWLASESGLTADPFFADVPRSLWELACQRWRPDSGPIFCGCTPTPVGAGLPAMAAWQLTFFAGVHIHCCGNGHLGFRLTATHFFFKRQKKVSKKRLAPSVRHLAKARRSLAPVSIWGHRLRSASRRPPLDVCGFAARRFAPAPQMNTSTRPPDGAGGSKSKACRRANARP